MMNSAPAVTSKYVLIHMCWFLFVCISNILSHCDVGGQNHVGIVAQLYPTLCYTLDYSSPSSSVHEISQARILEWVATYFSRGYSWPRDQTQVSCIAGRFFSIWAFREASTAVLVWCGMKRYLIVVSICISLMDNDFEHLFIYLLTFCRYSLEKHLSIQILCPF